MHRGRCSSERHRTGSYGLDTLETERCQKRWIVGWRDGRLFPNGVGMKNFNRSVGTPMKSPKRPFVVEVKRRRSITKPSASIWAGIDLVGAAETLEAAGEETRPAERPVADRGDAAPEPRLEPQIEPDALSDTVSHTAEEDPPPAMTETPRTKGKRFVHLGRVERTALPRAERWKRRLPRLFRTGRGS